MDLRCNEFHLLTTCGPNRSQKTEVRRVHRSTARLFIRYFFNVHEKKKRAMKNARHSTVEAARWAKRSKRSPLHTPNVTFSGGVQFSRDSIREFNDRKYEKIESCSLWSRPYTLASSCHIAGRMESSGTGHWIENMAAKGACLCCSNFRYVEPLEIKRNVNLIREM